MFYPNKVFTQIKDLIEKAAAIKIFEYSPLGKELKKYTSAADKQYQGLNKFFKPYEEEEPVVIKKGEPVTIQKESTITGESKLLYDSKHSFSNCKNVTKYYDLSFITKDEQLPLFYHGLTEFRNLVPRAVKTKIKKKRVYKNVPNLYNTLLTIY